MKPERKTFDPHATGALDGVRVVDLSRLVAGNILTKVLADHGAEVVKVEPPEGDTLRAWRINGISTAWKTLSRNKKSVALKLRDPEAIAVVKQLVTTAAIFVESFRAGVLEQMGLGPDELHAINPRLVIVRVSGWGQTGPYRERAGYDFLMQGFRNNNLPSIIRVIEQVLKKHDPEDRTKRQSGKPIRLRIYPSNAFGYSSGGNVEPVRSRHSKGS